MIVGVIMLVCLSLKQQWARRLCWRDKETSSTPRQSETKERRRKTCSE